MHTNFHYPNTLRAFFTACTNSRLYYYVLQRFYFHEKYMLGGFVLQTRIYQDVEDELHRDVNWRGEKQINRCDQGDLACRDWVEVRSVRGNATVLFINGNAEKGDGWMYNALMGCVSMIQGGGIIDC